MVPAEEEQTVNVKQREYVKPRVTLVLISIALAVMPVEGQNLMLRDTGSVDIRVTTLTFTRFLLVPICHPT